MIDSRWFVGTLAGLLVLPTAGYSARPDFAQEPLFIGSAVAPNLMFIIDDSGSMEREYMPDELGNDLCNNPSNCPWYFSSAVNTIWFDPDLQYLPPRKADGTGRKQNSPFTGAYYYGYADNMTTAGDANLENVFPTWRNTYNEPAFYYQLDESSDACVSSPKTASCYTKVVVKDQSDEERQNFANWFTYYSTRMYMSRAGIAEAFFELPTSFRLGWGRINRGQNDIDDASDVRAIVSGVREYSNDQRSAFLGWLYDVPASGNTPLRRALEGAGQYFEESERAWSDDPSKEVSETNPVRECRLSYSILMSDGYYNGSDPSSDVYQADDVNGSAITNERGDSFEYLAVDPFKDGRNSRTLADVAMYYWKRDLRTDINNYVPVSERNPAFWQHMVTYTVGLGVAGSVDPVAAFKAIEDGTYLNWWGGTSDEDKVNDMLHAAVNARGGFFSASNPSTFAKELKGTVGDITAEAGSSTAVEFDVSSFQEGALIFSSQFDPNGWTGDLKAVELGGTDTPVVPDIEDAIEAGNGWSAGDLLDERDISTNERVIITYGNGSASPFLWDDLTDVQKNDLRYGGVTDTVAEQRLNFIRGDRSLEDTTEFRKRGSRLGSIVNSSPEFVGAPRAIWPDSDPFGESSERFSDFAETNKDRSPVVYVGSNDGMLHGFSATKSGGQEVLAYIPEFVYNSTADNAGLHFLTDPAYQHRYYVDLEIRQQDIYTKGKRANGNLTNDTAWRSVIVGGGRAGAKGIFALDVTDPSSFSESNAESIVLWEFTAGNDNKLGYVTQAPIIGMAKWGSSDIRWTAFVSNGYNSTEDSTGFFMLDIEGGMDGTWESDEVRYVEFDSDGDGLSPLSAFDTTGDYLIDRIYAGDLDGKLWVADGTNGSWGTAYSNASGPQPLFTAASNQPITAAPVAAANKDAVRAGNEPNLLIFFGTGQYLESDDVTSTNTQSVYGLWDKGVAGLTRSTLEPRTLDEATLALEGEATAEVRYSNGDALDFSEINGWYADLDISGERAVVSPQVRGEFLYLNTIIPDQNPCLGGGAGWILAFGLDGRTPESRAFLDFSQIVTGYKINSMPNQSTILGNFRFTPGSDGDEPVDVVEIPPLSGAVTNAGRRGWNELVE
ncbi:PilC/PilY family type IV pilus protein [Marinobacter manganoxydans]|uniref:Neisseria PilC domain-containing protein n=1 Tax=Marinobacter manganoxydans MnI7-9 TaxID=1094979 RepID=G6YPT8_9GAMM|nr:PilC/PilY family type IV pilus protein [Marinobacter manganoxydans]EHJ05714.1 Neisseria PilC domain-containing protein [Marinobacter manganoxydans MnI7-9]